MDTIGSPRKFNFCLAENQRKVREPFHVDQGFARETNAITVFPTLGERDVSFNGQLSPEHLLRQISIHIDGGHNGDGYLETRGDSATPEKGRLSCCCRLFTREFLADGGFLGRRRPRNFYHTVTRPAKQHLEVGLQTQGQGQATMAVDCRTARGRCRKDIPPRA